MTGDRIKSKRLVGLFLLGVVLFNYPILFLFDKKMTLMGIPLMYVYIFSAWAAIILLIGLITRIRWFVPPPPASHRGK